MTPASGRCPYSAFMSVVASRPAAPSEAPAAPRRRARGRSLLGTRNPFEGGDLLPSRVPFFEPGRPCKPFPHPWNYEGPLEILHAFYWSAHEHEGPSRHSRYFEVPGLPLGLVTRDPAVIRAVLLATGDKPGQFHRDTSPTEGIARATGANTMLYANGSLWRRQKKMAARAFSRSSLFQAEKFHAFEDTFRATVMKRVGALRARQLEEGEAVTRVRLEEEIAVVMMEMLVRNFFGGEVTHEQLRDRFVPSVTSLIGHMVRNTVGHQYVAPVRRFFGGGRRARAWARDFEQLVDIALAGRKEGRASWADFDSDVPDELLRANIRVFLAGALEATTSMASWALVHLARRPDLQERIFAEVESDERYHPDRLDGAVTLRDVLEETLRLTPSLYFLPRYAGRDTWLEIEGRGTLFIPRRTHVVLDVWHANRNEEFWGRERTGYRAETFAPERWARLREGGAPPPLHFGFGHGSRVCPGKFLGLLEVSLVVASFVKLFRFTAASPEPTPRAAVSTKPADGALVDLVSR